MKEVELFVPYRFEKRPICENEISRMFGHKALYVSKGRYAITHILKSYGITGGKIAISAYMCPSVEITLKKKGYKVVYYDIDLKDLNPDILSIYKVIEEEKPKALVIASMYGNPANLTEIESLCRDTNVIMIDDAAQSFGAKLDGRYVGSFGDGGFFSFSPAKPTAAHRGGYFWTKKSYEVKGRHHLLFALITYKDFIYRRYLSYEQHPFARLFWFVLYSIILRLPVVVENDKQEKFEEKIIGGALYESIGEAINYRNRWIDEFKQIDTEDSGYLLLSRNNASYNGCKIVYVFTNRIIKDRFESFLDLKKIAYYTGYKVPVAAANCTNANKIEGMVVELPIDPFEDKMEYLRDCVKSFFMNK